MSAHLIWYSRAVTATAWATLPLEDALLKDALTDAFHGYHMGMTAENICDQWGLTREQLDEFCCKQPAEM